MNLDLDKIGGSTLVIFTSLELLQESCEEQPLRMQGIRKRLKPFEPLEPFKLFKDPYPP